MQRVVCSFATSAIAILLSTVRVALPGDYWTRPAAACVGSVIASISALEAVTISLTGLRQRLIFSVIGDALELLLHLLAVVACLHWSPATPIVAGAHLAAHAINADRIATSLRLLVRTYIHTYMRISTFNVQLRLS
eukprot:GHVU01123375.1.p1 GENE.GHVU01123375.1~~GHVU01123375.1.p1  ORF type:complete len:136 (-),score=12.64 GHVU01123375.1:249-656(-)